jgi:UDP-GlcNAc:undecaprenyl-phosphate GlcNAc-1-phosphate transferase
MQTPALLGATTFLFSLLLTPVFRKRSRGVGKGTVLRLGSMPIASACLLGCALVFVARSKTGQLSSASPSVVLHLLAAALLVFVAACLVYRSGLHIQAIAGFDIGAWSLPLTAVWILVCGTAMSLINRVDDLAVGVGLLATSAMLILALVQNNFVLELATIPLAGSILGFLPYTFSPPKMLLGESGSLLIGFMLGCYSILWTQSSGTALGMAVPLLVLSVPLLDTALVMLRRFLCRQPLGTNDTSHMYHRLLSRGLTPRKVRLVLYLCTAIGAVVSVLITKNQHFWMVTLLFYGVVWIWIQDLGYIELRVAGRMLMEGAFLRQLHTEVNLASYESRLIAASTPEQYWAVVVDGLKEFGFHEAQLAIADTTFEWRSETPSFGLWEVSVPIVDLDYIRLSRAFGTGIDANGFARFVDIVRRSLTVKRGAFINHTRALEASSVKVGG